jgi:hypothetical protein
MIAKFREDFDPVRSTEPYSRIGEAGDYSLAGKAGTRRLKVGPIRSSRAVPISGAEEIGPILLCWPSF